MQVSVEKVSNIERRLTIVVPASEVEQAFSQKIDQFAKQAKVKGFRPGKAPLSVVKQQFGGTAWEEAMSQVVERSLYTALTENNLRPVNTPRIEPKVSAPNQPLEFVVSFEVFPEVGTVKLVLEKIEKAIVDVKEEDITRVVDQLRKQYTKWQLVDRAAKESDRVVVDYSIAFDGEADNANPVQNFPIELGSKSMLPGFEEGLLGSKAGEERSLTLTLPEDFSDKEKAGKPISFKINIKQVFVADMPPLDNDFVKRLGVKSGDFVDLTQQIRQSLEQERDRLVRDQLKEQLFRQLLEQNPIDVPQSLVAREAKNIHDEIYQNQQHDHHQHSEDEMGTFNETAKKRVALGVLISEFAKQEKIKADQEKVQKRIMEIASSYENPKEVIEWLTANERRGGIEAQVLEDQVLEKLMDGIAVTEKKMSYAELKGIRI